MLSKVAKFQQALQHNPIVDKIGYAQRTSRAAKELYDLMQTVEGKHFMNEMLRINQLRYKKEERKEVFKKLMDSIIRPDIIKYIDNYDLLRNIWDINTQYDNMKNDVTVMIDQPNERKKIQLFLRSLDNILENEGFIDDLIKPIDHHIADHEIPMLELPDPDLLGGTQKKCKKNTSKVSADTKNKRSTISKKRKKRGTKTKRI